MELLNTVEKAILTSLPEDIQKLYNDAIEAGHPHAKRLPLMNPFHVLLICILYLIIVFVGKAIMKNREKFELKQFSILHNGFLVALSAYMSFQASRLAILHGYSLFGNGVDETERGFEMAQILWLFYISKPVEFIDTFIMVLKKNDRQISFLHVYHHVTIFFIWWVVVYYGPGGDGYFSAAQNSFIHVIMYSYYLMTALGIRVPWKSYITLAQMTQFLLNLLQGLYNIFLPTKYPRFLAWVLVIYMISLLILFANFYRAEQKRLKAERAKLKSN